MGVKSNPDANCRRERGARLDQAGAIWFLRIFLHGRKPSETSVCTWIDLPNHNTKVASKMNEFAIPATYEKTLEMLTVPHPNERVELAMQILECRRKLRQAGRDQIEIEKLQAEMARLEQELREIDE